MIHQWIINLKCITLTINILHVLTVLNLLKVLLCINYGGYGNHCFVKVQVNAISMWDMHQFDLLSDHIWEWNTSYTLMHLRRGIIASIVSLQLFLPTLGIPRLSVFLCSISHWCWYFRSLLSPDLLEGRLWNYQSLQDMNLIYDCLSLW